MRFNNFVRGTGVPSDVKEFEPVGDFRKPLAGEYFVACSGAGNVSLADPSYLVSVGIVAASSYVFGRPDSIIQKIRIVGRKHG